MMNVYALKFSLNAAIDQVSMLNALKSAGDEVIQSSDGLYVRSPRDGEAFRAWLRDNQFDDGVTTVDLNPDEIREDKDAAPDLKAFAAQAGKA